jgi:hypothetical protein
MSVRKRAWKNPKGETKAAWVIDYVAPRRPYYADVQAEK